MVRTQDIHPRHIQAHDTRGSHSGGALFRGDTNQAGTATPMQVGAELARRGLAFHGCNNLAAYHKTTDICAAGFLDVFLHHHRHIQPHKGFDYRFRRLAGFRQHHADALGAFQHLDHQRRTAHHVDQVGNIIRRVGKTGDGQPNAFAREQLQRTQLVPGARDGYRFIDREDTHHFKLTHHRRTVLGNRGANTWNHRIKPFQHFTLVVNFRLVSHHAHVTAQGVDHMHFMARCFAGFDHASRGIQALVSGKNRNFHGCSFVPPRRNDAVGSTVIRSMAVRPSSMRNFMFSRSVRVISMGQ